MAQSRKDDKGRSLRKGECFKKSKKLYCYSYSDPFGRRQYIYSKDLVKLRTKEENLVRNQLDGLDVYVAGRATLNFVFDRYINTKKELRSTTYSNYVYNFDHFVRDTFGKKKVADIKFSDVIYFYQYLLDEKKISISTLEGVHTVVHPTLRLAVRDNIIRINPSDGALGHVKKKFGKSSGVRHALTLEQERAFLNFLNEEENVRWRPIFTVLLGTGCRIGEVIGLRWDDLDFEKRIISINHSVSYYARRDDTSACEFAVSLPKTEAGVRTIPMLDAVFDAFQEEKQMQEVLGIHCMSEVNGMNNFIFCNRFGNLHNPQSLNRAIKRLTEDYNAGEIIKAKKENREPVIIPHFSCHHLRHTFCTRFCERETNVKVIQAVMGHADITTTMNIYAEVTDAAKIESFENLSRNLNVF